MKGRDNNSVTLEKVGGTHAFSVYRRIYGICWNLACQLVDYFLDSPLPNEMAFAYPGMISALYSYNQFFAFVIAYSGLVVHIVVGYSIGRGLITRYPIKRQPQSREKIMDIINKVEKYGRIGILFSFFIPGIRFIFSFMYVEHLN
ncbi:hypothetical protein [Bacillus coahuilensis]|uniref:hypothetical protein n=1 Tax=Bacillus coahuilensis TaxID=408580 RepID=UPI0001850D3C|nr:hypothetical protein [Bacillus coahuilensis]